MNSLAAHGVLCIMDNVASSPFIDSVQLMDALGYSGYWVPEVLGREAMSTAGYLLAKTERIAIATGIANVYVRDAHATMQARHTLCEVYGERFILGLGVSNVGISELRGYNWQPPIQKVNEYLDQMEACQPDAAPVSTMGAMHIAAHGPKLQALASERSDGVITYLMSHEHTAVSRERIGDDSELSVTCMMLAEEDPLRARSVARKALAYYLTLDYYHREWRKVGFSDADFADGGSDALIDMIVGWGDQQSLQKHIGQHLKAGASRILIMPLDVNKEGLTNSPTLKALAPNRGE